MRNGRHPAIFSGIIYRFKRGQVSAYSANVQRFNCLSPADDWPASTVVGDVWICDDQGNIDPGLNVSPVPVPRSSIDIPIARFPGRKRVLTAQLDAGKWRV